MEMPQDLIVLTKGLKLNRFRLTALKVGSYASAQGIVQAANIATGFILVRAMPKSEYAWFTIVTAAMATISILADSGLGSAFTAIGGKHYQDHEIFAGLASYIRRKRLRFLAVAAAVTLPFSTWALIRNGTPLWVAILLLLLVVLATMPATDTVVLITVNKLHRRVRNLVEADLWLSLTKLGLVGAIVLLGTSALSALACVVVATWVQFAVLRHQTSDLLGSGLIRSSAIEDFGPQIHQTVVHVLPICIFTCIQGQLSTYILSYFSTSSEVADFGALMRLAVVFTLFSIPIAQLVLPALARCQDANKLRGLLGRITAGLVLIGLFVVAIAYLFSPYLLWTLGNNYKHLKTELLLFMTVSALGFIANTLWGIAFARGWIKFGWVGIPLTLMLQVGFAFFIDLSEVSGVILFSSINQIVGLVVTTWLILVGLGRENSSRPRETLAS